MATGDYRIEYMAVECEKCGVKAERSKIVYDTEILYFWNCFTCGWHRKSREAIKNKPAPVNTKLDDKMVHQYVRSGGLIPDTCPRCAIMGRITCYTSSYGVITFQCTECQYKWAGSRYSKKYTPTLKPKTSADPEPADPVNLTATGPQTTPKPVSTSAADAAVWTIGKDGKLIVFACVECGETKNLSTRIWNPTEGTTKYIVNCCTCGRVWDVDKPLAFSPRARTVPDPATMSTTQISTDGATKQTNKWESPYDCLVGKSADSPTAGTKPLSTEPAVSPDLLYGQLSSQLSGSQIYDYIMMSPLSTYSGSLLFTPSHLDKLRLEIQSRLDTARLIEKDKLPSTSPTNDHKQLNKEWTGTQLYNYFMSPWTVFNGNLLLTAAQWCQIRIEIQARLSSAGQIEKDKRDNRLEIIRKLFEDKE